MNITLSAKAARIVKWWAKRTRKSIDEVVDDVFYSFFHVVEGTYIAERGFDYGGSKRTRAAVKRRSGKRGKARRTDAKRTARVLRKPNGESRAQASSSREQTSRG